MYDQLASLEQLRARFADIPIMQTLDLTADAAGPGTATIRMKYKHAFDGVFHSLHGGLLMTLADTVACASVMTLAGVDCVITTTDMSIRFLAPCRTDAIAEAHVIKFGRTLVPTEVNLRDTNGILVAIAQVTYMRLK